MTEIYFRGRTRWLFFSLVAWLLLGLAGRSQAQLYYLMNDGAATTTLDELRRSPLAPASEAILRNNIVASPGNIAVDLANNRVFVADVRNNLPNIVTISLTAPYAVATFLTPAPISGATNTALAGIAVDNVNGFLYYLMNDGAATTTLDELRRSPLAAASETILRNSIVSSPGTLALDVPNNRIFVADVRNNLPNIVTVGLTAPYSVATFLTPAPISGATNTALAGIAVDNVNGFLYYLMNDGAATTTLDELRRSPLAAASETILRNNVVSSPGTLALDIPNNRVFVADVRNNLPNIVTVGLMAPYSVATFLTPAPISGATNTALAGIATVPVPSPTTVVSINRANPTPTNAASVSYTVTFAASVTGLTGNNFSLVANGVSGASITNVSGSGTTYTVTVNTGSGSGTLTLNLSNDAGLNRSISNRPFTGQTYTIDKTAPTVSLVSSTVANNGSTTVSPVAFTAQFSESVGSSFTASDITVSNGSSISNFAAGSAANSYTFAVTPAVGTVTVSIAAGAAQDNAGNNNIASGPFTFTYALPTTAPTVTTDAATSVTGTSAVLGGNVTANGGANVTERGVVYVVGTATPTINDTKVPISSGSGPFSQTVTGLRGNTTYSVRAYASNNAGTSYGAIQVFTTPNNPPTANADAVTVAEDSGPTVVDVLTNDSSAPDLGETLSVTAITQPTLAGGTVLLSGGVVRFTPTSNFNGPTTFTYTISDGNGGTATASVTVTVTAVNDAPTVTTTAGPTTFTQGAAAVTVDNGLTVSDVDSPTLASATVSITAGLQTGQDVLTFTNTSATTFGNLGNATSSTGTLTLTSSGATATLAQWQAALRSVTFLNTSATPSLAVRTISFVVNDGSLNSAPATKSVQVQAVNQAPTVPTDADPAPNTVAENAATGTLVGLTVAATDADSPTLTYSLTADAGGRFAINATTGVVSVANGALLNFESATSHSITAQVSDGTLSSSQSFIIQVTDVNEAPALAAQSYSVPEGSANGTVVGTVVASDPDAGQSLSYAITAGNTGGAFTFVGNQLRVANSAALDYTTTPTFALTVRVTDNGTPALSATATITVQLTPVTTVVYRLNAGAGALNTSLGPFAADQYFSPSRTFSTTAPIAGTVDDALYQTERFEGAFGYALPVANGTYSVVLHFAELYWTQAGQRVFDVSAEGQLALDNYDIVAKVGSLTATTETLQVTVTDGVLNLDFSALAAVGGKDAAKLSALEVLAPMATRPASPLATSAAQNRVASWLQASPNPFTNQVSLSFQLLRSEAYSLTVYDLAGRELLKRAGELVPAGRQQQVALPMEAYPTGVYLVHLRTASGTQQVRLVKR